METGELLANTTALAVMGAVTLLTVLMSCRIFSKAGFHGALGLLMFVPVANLVLMLMFAFKKWPIENELKELRKLGKAVHKADTKHYSRAA